MSQEEKNFPYLIIGIFSSIILWWLCIVLTACSSVSTLVPQGYKYQNKLYYSDEVTADSVFLPVLGEWVPLDSVTLYKN